MSEFKSRLLIPLCPRAYGGHSDDSDNKESNRYHLLSTYDTSGTCLGSVHRSLAAKLAEGHFDTYTRGDSGSYAGVCRFSSVSALPHDD